MVKPVKKQGQKTSAQSGSGGETHQTTISADNTLTTNQGLAVSDNQNSLKGGLRGPTLLEDMMLREKITHFDHERIPERIVHARGSGAHGFFQAFKGASRFSKAAFLQDPEQKTRVFVRFSTVAGGAGSVDTPRDVRGFAVKFYTEEGNFDLVGNNIPVFFIQDAMKFPDLIHSVKMDPDRGFPQAASAHDTFWDFASLMPESIRLGGPNFHEIPINKPVCPMRNFQRDGHMRMAVPTGRVSYEPNSLAPESPRENPKAGFTSFPDPNSGPKLRQRPESFADHYSQARQFWRSMTAPEQDHIADAFTFELSKVETPAIRFRMLGHLDLIEPVLGERVAEAMGLAGKAEKIVPAVTPRDDLEPSPALSLVAKAPAVVKGRTVAILVTDGSDAKAVGAVQRAVKKEGGTVKLVAPRIGELKGNGLVPDMTIEGAPSVLFDAVVLLPSDEGAKTLVAMPPAVNWLRDAFGHLKAIGFNAAAQPLFDKGGLDSDAPGVIVLKGGVEDFIDAARKHKIWDRNP